MAKMDIPRVLSRIRPGLHQGNMAHTGRTYEEFAPYWPVHTNGPVPTKQEMEAEWAKIEAEDAAKPTEAQTLAKIDSEFSGQGGPGNVQKHLKILMTQAFRADPDGFIKRHGL